MTFHRQGRNWKRNKCSQWSDVNKSIPPQYGIVMWVAYKAGYEAGKLGMPTQLVKSILKETTQDILKCVTAKIVPLKILT